jgi:hypothetical protein
MHDFHVGYSTVTTASTGFYILWIILHSCPEIIFTSGKMSTFQVSVTI